MAKIVENFGVCLICLNWAEPGELTSQSQIKYEPEYEENLNKSLTLTTPLSLSSMQIRSIKCLSKYLNIEYSESESVEFELCHECSLTNNKFSSLYSKLEVIEMELNFYLEKIMEKVRNKNERKLMELKLKHKMGEFDKRNFQKLKKIRKEIYQKYSSNKKVKSGLRVKISKLSENKKAGVQVEENFEENSSFANSLPNIKIEPDYSDNDNEMEEETNFDNFSPEPVTVLTLPKEDDNQDEPQQITTKDNPISGSVPNDNTSSSLTPTKTDKDNKLPPPPPLIIRDDAHKLPSSQILSFDPKSRKYSCQICSKQYGKSFLVLRHYRSSHLKQRYKCLECDMEFSALSSYKTHYKHIHLRLKLSCKRCEKSFSSRSGLMEHGRVAHFDMTYLCEFCSGTFGSLAKLQNHLKDNCRGNK